MRYFSWAYSAQGSSVEEVVVTKLWFREKWGMAQHKDKHTFELTRSDVNFGWPDFFVPLVVA